MRTETWRVPMAAVHKLQPKPNAIASSGESLLAALLRQHVVVKTRNLRRGETLFDAGDPFSLLHVVTAGSFKSVCIGHEGQPRMAALHLPNDWLGFEGIASGSHAWRAEALDDARVSSVAYEDLLRAARVHPELLRRLHAEMGHEMEQQRLQKLQLRGQATETRICRLLLRWVERCEPPERMGPVIAHLPLARAEIGDLLGMTVESASRAISGLVRDGVIEFSEGNHRDIRIRNMAALRALAQPAHNVAAAGMAPPVQNHRPAFNPLAP